MPERIRDVYENFGIFNCAMLC